MNKFKYRRVLNKNNYLQCVKRTRGSIYLEDIMEKKNIALEIKNNHLFSNNFLLQIDQYLL
jgi:hypothetical protein